MTAQPLVQARSASAVLLLLLAHTPSAIFAQTQPSAAPAAETPVQLSTFTVNSQRDYGYRATNSITATGIGTEIYRTPINISVVTSDLIQDVGAFNIRDSLQYTANVYSDHRDPEVVKSRGFDSPILINRTGVPTRNPTPDFVERIEVVKGPNSVFFGRVSPAGVVNLITLQPKSTTQTEVRATYGSYDHAQGFISHNQTLGKNAALLVAGSFLDRSDGYSDWTFRRANGGYAAFRWDLQPNLQFKLVASIDEDAENVVHSIPRGHPGYRTYTQANPTSTLTIQQWRDAFIPGQPYMIMYLDPNEIFPSGRKGNNGGPDNYRVSNGWFVQPELIYTPAEWLTIRAAGYSGGFEREFLEISGFPTFNGTYLSQRASFSGIHTLTDSGELEAVFTFNTGPASHRLLLGARLSAVRSGSWAAGNTIPVTWNTFTDGPRRLSQAFTGGLIRPAFAMPRSEETGFYAIDQIGFAQDRVKLLLGARQTEVTNIGSTTVPVSVDRSQKETTPQVGLLVEAVKGIALFANYSKTFEPQFNVDARDNLADNITGKGKEVGFKFDLQDKVWSGTVAWFQVERSGEIRRDFSTEVSTGISPLFIAGGTKRSEGMDFETFFTPSNNYQAVFSYTYLWEAKVVTDTTTPAIVGRRLERSPEHLVSLWNKYTFTKGSLKNLSVGLGARYASVIDTLTDPNFNLKNPSYVVADASFSYATKFSGRPVTLQLNVKNLLDRDYLDGNFIFADPRVFYFTVGTKF